MGNLTLILLAVAVTVAGIEVFSRYILLHSFAWANELVTFTIVMATLLNYGLAQRSDSHIRVTLFTSYLKGTWKEIANIFSQIVGIVLSIIIIYHVFYLALEVKRLNFCTEVLRIPTCIGYFVLGIGFLLLMLHYVLDLYKSVDSLTRLAKDSMQKPNNFLEDDR